MELIRRIRALGKAMFIYSIALVFSGVLYLYILYVLSTGYRRDFSRFISLVASLSLYVSFSTTLLLGSLRLAYNELSKLSRIILDLKPLASAFLLLLISHAIEALASLMLLRSYLMDNFYIDPTASSLIIFGFILMIIGFILVGTRLRSLEIIGLKGLSGPPLITLGGILTIFAIGLFLSRLGFLLSSFDLLSISYPPQSVIEEIKSSLLEKVERNGFVELEESLLHYVAAYELVLERGFSLYRGILSRIPLVVL